MKNRFSPLGFLLFHVSLILCLLGGLVIMYTRFASAVVITEGQEFDSNKTPLANQARAPKLFVKMPRLRLLPESITPRYEQGVPSHLDVDLKVGYRDDPMDNVSLGINEPVRRGPFSILGERVGIAPLFVLRDTAGAVVDAAFVSLEMDETRFDMFRFPTVPHFMFQIRLSPGFSLANGLQEVRGEAQKMKLFRLVVEHDGQTTYDGPMGVGEQVYFDHMTLECQEIRYWVRLLVVREYGSSILIAGFILGGIGLVMRLILYQKRITVTITEEVGCARISVGGKSEYFPYSFREELEGIVAGMVREFGRRQK